MTDNNTNGFTGIWNRENPNSKILDIANEMGEVKGPVGKKDKPKRTWSFIDFFISLVLLFTIQIVITIPLFSSIVAGDDPNAFLEAATAPGYILASSLSMYLVWVGCMWFATRFRGARSFKKDFQLAFKRWDALIGLGIAVGLYVTLFVVQLILTEGFGVDLAGADNGQLILGQEGIWFLIIGVGIASILGPAAEELYFRGFLMNSVFKSIEKRTAKVNQLKLTKDTAPITVGYANFLTKIKNPLAVIASSLVFGIFHFQGTLDFGGIFIMAVTGTLGAVFAIVTIKTGRLGPAIFGHVFYNFGTLMLAFIFTQ